MEGEKDKAKATTSPEGSDSAASPETDLTSTVGAFSSLIQAKIKEQEVKVGEIEQATQSRHALMLETLMNIRKSLLDVARIDLGKRYFFEQANDDFQGWPRLRILLKDTLDDQAELPFFQVTAHDRNAQGTLEVLAGGADKLTTINVVDSNELVKLPSTLKKTVRVYLDAASEVILSREEPEDQHDDEKVALDAGAVKSFVEQSQRISNDDLFSDDNALEDFLEKLPQLGSLDRLPIIEEADPKKTSK